MNFEEADKYLFPNYARLPYSFVKGEGCYLYDENGKNILICFQALR
jgi:Ornithine/acetylornithine aminotransferase